MFLGPEALREVIENAELYPIKGLFRFSDYFDEVDAYYHRSLGFEFGVSTGWMGLNELYNVNILLVLFPVHLFKFLRFCYYACSKDDYIY